MVPLMVIIIIMFVKTLCVVCDQCEAEVQGIGPDATTGRVTALARAEGWACSSVGHHCPEHRQRAPKTHKAGRH